MEKTPQQIIEGIRKDRLSGSEGTLGRLSRAVGRLADDLYQKKFHFIMELIQNADDNEYDKSVIPTLKIIVSADKIILINNEKGFEEKQVSAISDIDNTTKNNHNHENRGYIGEKGIGFKSVFKITDTPYIFSNGFQFRFNKAKEKNLAYILPKWVECEFEDVELDKTNIVLPFNQAFKYQENTDFEKHEISKELSQIKPTLLLFLRKLRRLEIINKLTGTHTIIEKEVITSETSKVQGLLENTVALKISINGNVESKKYFLIEKNRTKVKDGLKEEKRKDVKTTSISIGFPLNKKLYPHVEKQQVYAYLPIKSYGFNFLINADFLLTSSRESVKECEWNEWLIEETYGLFIEAIEIFKENSKFKKTFLKYIPNTVNDDLFISLAKDIEGYCRTAEVFTTTTSKHPWTSLDRIVTGTDDDQSNIKAKILSKYSNKYYSDIKDKEIIDFFDIQNLSSSDVLACLDDNAWVEKLRNKQLKVLYIYLDGKFRGCYDELESKQIIKTEKCGFVSLNSETVYLRPSSKKGYSFEKRLCIINKDLINSEKGKEVERFFNHLGIKEPKPSEIINAYILKEFERKGESLHTNTIVSFTKYIKEHFEEYKRDNKNSYLENLKESIVIIGQNDDKIRLDNVYFSKAYKPKYDLEILLQGISNINFLSDKYFEKEESIEEWRLFFKDIGVHQIIKIEINEFDRIHSYENQYGYIKKEKTVEEFYSAIIVKIIEDNEPKKIGILLQVLNDNWESYYRDYSKWDDYLHNRSWKNRSKESDWFKTLKKTPIFFINNKAYLSESTYYLKEKEANLFKNRLPLLTGITLNDEDFLEVIGVKTSVSLSEYMELLRSYASQSEIEDDNIPYIYEQIYSKTTLCNFDRTKTAFRKEKLFYQDGAWYSIEEMIWEKPKQKIFKGFFVAVNKRKYIKLKTFFIDKLGITESIDEGNIVENLTAVISQYSHQEIDKKTRTIIEEVYVAISGLIDKSDDKEQLISQIKKAKIFINQHNQLVNSNNYYYADNDLYYNAFKDQGVNIFKPSEKLLKNEKKVIEFFEVIDIYQPLSKAVKVTILNTTDSKGVSKSFKSKYKYAIKALICNRKKFKSSAEFEAMIKKGVFGDLIKTEIRFIPSIEASYQLGSLQQKAKSEKAVHDLANKIIYIEENLDDFSINSLIARAISTFLKEESLEDFITLLLEAKTDSEIKQRLRTKDIRWLSEAEWKEVFQGKVEKLDIFEEVEGKKEVKENSPLPKSTPKKNSNENKGDYHEANIQSSDNLHTEKKENYYDTDPFAIPKDESEIITASTNKRRDGLYTKSDQNTKRQSKPTNKEEYEDGEWAERAVFLRIIEDLKEEYKDVDYETKETDNEFDIFIDDNIEVSLSWLNVNKSGKYVYDAPGRDLELKHRTSDPIYIEVKGRKGNYGEYEISNRQWRELMERKENYWIYFVAQTGTPDSKFHVIKNPYKEFLEGRLEISSGVRFNLMKK